MTWRRLLLVAALAAATGCGEKPPANGVDAGVDAGGGSDAGPDASFDAGPDGSVDAGLDGSIDAGIDAGMDASVDAGTDASVDAGADAGLDAGTDAGLDASVPDAGSWRSSLAVCWTDATCRRVMAIAHGGAWDTTLPYDSNGAIAAAYAGDLDGVKIDVRVTSDNVPVIAHSSPIELFESIDCYNQRIELMTAAQVTRCHRVPSTTETFQRLDDVLTYLRGKMVVQLCVKRQADYARAIQAVHAANAEDFAFLEISTSDLQTLIPTISGSGTIWYLINVASNLPEVDTLLTLNNPRAFMYEFDPSAQLGTMVTARLHPAGVRSFVYDSSATASVQQLKAYFDRDIDVVSAQTAANDVQARRQVNQARGVSPP